MISLRVLMPHTGTAAGGFCNASALQFVDKVWSKLALHKPAKRANSRKSYFRDEGETAI